VFIVEFQNQLGKLLTYCYEDTFVRVVTIDGEPWFVAKDLAKVLGYSSTGVLLRLVEKEDKRIVNPRDLDPTVLAQFSLEEGFRLSIINESGLYDAIFSSTMEGAKKFKKWVTNDVLPTIRKTGGYNHNVVLEVIQQTATVTAQETAQHFLPYVEECQKMEKTYEEFPGLKTLIQSLQDQPDNEDNNQRLTIKEAILVLGRPFLKRGDRVHCGQLVCAWLGLNFNRACRKKGQPTRYKKKYLPLIDYAIGHILRKRGMTLGA
jgi:prophage antirepressor-like protein